MASNHETEYIRDRKGRLVEFKDKELREKVNELISTASRAEEIANAATEFAEAAEGYMVGVKDAIDAQAEAAAASAESASGYATAASGYSLDASQYALNASNSATAAGESASSAGSSADLAMQASESAQLSASNAASDASSAATSAQSASQYATNAASDAVNASTCVIQAQEQVTLAQYQVAIATTCSNVAGQMASNAENSATTAAGKVTDAEAWAVGQRNGSDVADTDDTYHNNSKYYAEAATDVLESIPQDYSTLSSDVTELKSDLNKLEKEGDISWLASEYEKKYLNNSNVENSNNSLSHTDYILIPQGAIKVRTSNQTSNSAGTSLYGISPNVLFYDSDKNFLQYANKNPEDGTIVEFDIPNEAAYIRANQAASTSPNGIRYLKFIYKEDGFVGEYSGTFTENSQILMTGIKLKGNTWYAIRRCFISNQCNRVNVYPFGNSSNFKRLDSYTEEVHLRNPIDGEGKELALYNNTYGTGNIHIKVFLRDAPALKDEYVPKHYIVSQSSYIGDYTSLTQCLLDLKEDDTPKIIEIREGDYDIYQEYVDANVPVYTGDDPTMEYFDYCVWIPNNTHIIGKGLVRLKWMPTLNDNPEITWKQCQTVSPVNVAGTMTLENVEIHCKNGRYCIHNDALGKLEYTGAVQKYINVKCYKYENETQDGNQLGFLPTTGFGIDRSMHHVYENCTFVNYGTGRAFYGHSRNAAGGSTLLESQSSDITLVNCAFITEGSTCIKFGSGSTNRNLHIRTMFNSCYISGPVRCQLETSSTAQCANSFDIQYLNCGNVSMQINDNDNPYTPSAYNTNLTMI